MKQSAGLLVYRVRQEAVEVFLVHPGGPFWAQKDTAAWSIPKGEFATGDDPLTNALREFTEETGSGVPPGTPLPLPPLKQTGGKHIYTWYLPGEPDAANVSSNTFVLEWPPRSGNTVEFPEIDKAGWFTLEEAKVKLHKGQAPIIEQLILALGLNQHVPCHGDLSRTVF